MDTSSTRPTSSGTMFLRLNAPEPPPWWEVALVAAVLAAAAWLALKVMAKMFRIGLLLYGIAAKIVWGLVVG